MRCLLIISILWLLAIAGVASAQTQPRAQQKEDATPAMVSAEALKRGAQFEGAARSGFVKWARSYAKQKFFDADTPPTVEEVVRAVEQRDPRAPAESRVAGAFLVMYLGYAHGTDAQVSIAARLRELNRQVRDLEEQLRLLESSPLRRTASDPRGPTVADEARAQQRLEDTVRQREFHRNHMDSLQSRVDVCLLNLAALYEQVKDVDPAVVRQLK